MEEQKLIDYAKRGEELYKIAKDAKIKAADKKQIDIK